MPDTQFAGQPMGVRHTALVLITAAVIEVRVSGRRTMHSKGYFRCYHCSLFLEKKTVESPKGAPVDGLQSCPQGTMELLHALQPLVVKGKADMIAH